MAAFTVGSSYLGGASYLGGGESGMNTGFDYFIRGEMFPFASSKDTAGFAYWNRGEVYPAIYYISSSSVSGFGVAPSLRLLRWIVG